MTCFKRLQSLSLIFVLALAGCSLKTKDSSLQTASFRVDTVGGSVENYASVEGWNLPSQRLFHLWTCIKDYSQTSIIANHRFEVSGGALAINTMTDTSGCAHWDEVIPFDIFATPTYVKILRHIKSLGKQRGTVDFTLAINPWSGVIGSEEAVVDLTRVSVPQLVDGTVDLKALKATREKPVTFEINDIDYKMDLDASSNAQDATLRLQFSPSVVTKDMHGNILRLPLEIGNVMVTPMLMRIDDARTGAKTSLLAPLAPKSVAIVNGTVVYTMPVKMISKIDLQKTYTLALKVEEKDGPSYIAPFGGVFEIADASNLHAAKLSLTSQFRADIANFKIDDYESTKVSNLAQMSSLAKALASGADRPQSFFFGSMSISQNGVLAETMMRRTVGAAISVDVHWLLSTGSVSNRVFSIFRLSPWNKAGPYQFLKDKATNDAGLLEWDDSVTHSYYKSQARTKYAIMLVDKITGQSYTKCALINPWDFYSTFGRDCDSVNDVTVPAAQLLSNAAPKVPTMKIDNVCMARTDSETVNIVKPDLSLEVKHRFNVSLDAKITRFDDFRQGNVAGTEPLRTGWWLMTIVVLRNDMGYTPPKKPGDTSTLPNPQTQGRVGDFYDNGNIKPIATIEKAICNVTAPFAEVELKLKELGIMDKRNYYAVQIQPLNQDKLRFKDESNPGANLSCTGSEVDLDNSVIEIINSQPKNDISDLLSKSFVFPFTPRAEGCAAANAIASNFSDPRLVEVTNYLQTNYPVLHDLHLETQRLMAQADQKIAALADDVDNGWQVTGTSRGINRNLEIKSDADVKNVSGLLDGKIGHDDLFLALSCLDEAFWADSSQKATCADAPGMLDKIKLICQATMADNPRVGDICKDPLTKMAVEEKMHVYHLQGSEAISGYSSSLGITNGFTVGVFAGSDYGSGQTDTFTVGVGGEVGAGKDFGLVKAGVAGSAGASHSQSSVNLNFTREWNDNQIGVSTGTTLTNEALDVRLWIDKYRECYLVRAKNDVDKNGYQICNGVSADQIQRTERYYMLFNPGSGAVMLNPADDRNRWMLQFRGAKFYFYLVGNISQNMAPFHVNSTPLPIYDIVQREQTKSLWDGINTEQGSWGEPFVLSTVPPDQRQLATDETKLKDYKLGGFNPFQDFNNPHFRNQNVPEDRAKDTTSQFTTK